MAMKLSADPYLAELAKQLSGITFPVTDYHTEVLDVLKRGEPGEGMRNVIVMFYGRVWGVRMFLGGKQRVIGQTTSLMDALRFADMARMKFWVYRIRHACEPMHSDLNFGTDSVRRDIEEMEPANELLNALEAHFVQTEVFPSAIHTEAQRKEALALRNKRRTLCGEVDTLRDGIASEFESQTKAIEKNTSELERVVGTLNQMRADINYLTKSINDLLNQAGTPGAS